MVSVKQQKSSVVSVTRLCCVNDGTGSVEMYIIIHQSSELLRWSWGHKWFHSPVLPFLSSAFISSRRWTNKPVLGSWLKYWQGLIAARWHSNQWEEHKTKEVLSLHRTITVDRDNYIGCVWSCWRRKVYTVSIPVAQLSADHLRMLLGPVVVTHRAPVAVVENFHSTLPGTVASHQTHHAIWNRFTPPWLSSHLTAVNAIKRRIHSRLDTALHFTHAAFAPLMNRAQIN